MTNDRLKSTAGDTKIRSQLEIATLLRSCSSQKGWKFPCHRNQQIEIEALKKESCIGLREKLLQQNQGDFLKCYTLHANHFISVNPIQFRDSMHALHLDSSSLILDSCMWPTHLFLFPGHYLTKYWFKVFMMVFTAPKSRVSLSIFSYKY